MTEHGENSSQGFDAFMGRLRQVMPELRTQQDLANHLGIRQSSVSDAKGRDSVPDAWLLGLLERDGLNPGWLRSGEGCRFLAPSDFGPPCPPPAAPAEPERDQVPDAVRAIFDAFPFANVQLLITSQDQLADAGAAVVQPAQDHAAAQ